MKSRNDTERAGGRTRLLIVVIVVAGVLVGLGITWLVSRSDEGLAAQDPGTSPATSEEALPGELAEGPSDAPSGTGLDGIDLAEAERRGVLAAPGDALIASAVIVQDAGRTAIHVQVNNVSASDETYRAVVSIDDQEVAAAELQVAATSSDSAEIDLPSSALPGTSVTVRLDGDLLGEAVDRTTLAIP